MSTEQRKLLDLGKAKGYVTYNEINAAMPIAVRSSQEIDGWLATLSDAGIDVVEHGSDDPSHDYVLGDAPKGLAHDLNTEVLETFFDRRFHATTANTMLPSMHSHLKEGGLLTIGINPGFSPDTFNRYLVGHERDKYDLAKSIAWQENPDRATIARIATVDHIARQRYAVYYGKFWRIAKGLGLVWQHLDVFPVRTKDVTGLVKLIGPLHALNEFGIAWVERLRAHVARLSPQIVLAANVAVAEILVKHLAATFDANAGHHMIHSTPTFFVGAGSFDRFSLERLVWHMGTVLRSKEPRSASEGTG